MKVAEDAYQLRVERTIDGCRPKRDDQDHSDAGSENAEDHAARSRFHGH
jgi:hypothetical protein